MAWRKILTSEQLTAILATSEFSPVVFFKHSARCPISSLALSRFENTFRIQDFYIIDVISQRDISQSIAGIMGIAHESPQLLLVSKNRCVLHASHLNISSDMVTEAIQGLSDK